MDGGKMLAINEGFGFRPVLIVQSFNFLPQLNERPATTFVYGMQCMFEYENVTGYVAYLRNFLGQSLLWDQLSLNVHDTEEQLEKAYPRMPLKRILEERLTLLSAGHDPLAGYYVQFAGPMRLFSQPRWWDEGEIF